MVDNVTKEILLGGGGVLARPPHCIAMYVQALHWRFELLSPRLQRYHRNINYYRTD